MMWGYETWGGLWMLLLLAGMVVLAIWAVQQFAPPKSPPAPERPDRALQILEERYARGEIDRDEFLARRADLERTQSA
ncbi:MAG: SHOCT domain-containing protein [Acidimicrobiia bacterium]